jgi:predicted ATP-grasp superfamily ATP-dependent carboligase
LITYSKNETLKGEDKKSDDANEDAKSKKSEKVDQEKKEKIDKSENEIIRKTESKIKTGIEKGMTGGGGGGQAIHRFLEVFDEGVEDVLVI